MTTSGIYLELGGEPVDLARISWYEKAPCGCVCGAHVAYSDFGGSPSILIATAEQAASEMWTTKKERAKYEALGFTLYPDLTSKCKDLLTADCPHDPKFGIPPRPQVEGYQWATVQHSFSRATLMHLVPDLAVEDARERRYGSDNGKPLCGGKREFWWSTEWYALDGKVECTRCVKKATAALAAEQVPA